MSTSGRHTRTTAQRGLGNPHKVAAKALIAKHIDGAPCGWCGEPMFKIQGLHADHSIPRSLGGKLPDRLLHGPCNEERRGVPYLSRAEWVASKRHRNTGQDASDLGKRVLRWP